MYKNYLFEGLLMITLEKRIKKSYIWGTLAVIAFLSFSFLSLSQLITQQKNDSKLINVAGKQRMLVQKIALHIHSYQEDFGAKNTPKEKRVLISLATNMYNEHLFLVNNTDALSIKVRSLYFDPQELLHEQIKLFTNMYMQCVSVSAM